MLSKLKQLPELAALLLLTLLGLLFFMLTNPSKLPPVALMIGFAILAGIVYSLLRLLGQVAGLHERLSEGRYRLLLGAGTALPVLLLALQSLGQLTIRDAITLVILFAAGFLYIGRMAT
jgi:hypothetical protein